MILDDLLDLLNELKLKHGGKVTVLSGLARSGYGEPVTDAVAGSAKTFTGGVEGETETIIELILDESSSHVDA